MKTVIEQIREQMADMAMEELIRIHNYDNSDAVIYELEERSINFVFSSPWEAVLGCRYGTLDTSDDYFTMDGYENPESFQYIDDPACPIDIDYLADWLADNEQLWDDFGIEVEIETEYVPLSFFETFYRDLGFNHEPFIDEIISEYSGTIIINADGEYIVDEDDHVTYTADDLLADYAEYIDEDKLTNLIITYWDLEQVNAREENGTFYVIDL